MTDVVELERRAECTNLHGATLRVRDIKKKLKRTICLDPSPSDVEKRIRRQGWGQICSSKSITRHRKGSHVLASLRRVSAERCRGSRDHGTKRDVYKMIVEVVMTLVHYVGWDEIKAISDGLQRI